MKYADGAAGNSRERGKSIRPAAKEPKRFTEEERAAMRERLKELAADTGRGKGLRQDQENAVLEKIQALPQPDRDLAERLHALIKAQARCFRQKLGMECLLMPKTGILSAFFKVRRNSKPAMPRLASPTRPNSIMGPCGQRLLP
jgi:hypothetical protein